MPDTKKLYFILNRKKITNNINYEEKIFNLLVNRSNLEDKITQKISPKKNKKIMDSRNNKIIVIVKPKIPVTVDHRKKFTQIYDQGNLGSCTGCALSSLLEYFHPSLKASRLFIYYNERKLDNNIPDDAGSTLENGINCLQKYGACQEIDWPYIIKNFAIQPLQKCYSNANKHLVTQVKSIDETLQNMKLFLSNGHPFVVGIRIYDSFISRSVSLTGNVPMPNLKIETLLGGHAVVCVGYIDNTKQWIMKNSWGSKWGVNGYFYLPYAYLTDHLLAGDMWTIIDINCIDTHNIK
jgi:C1A family cysteine protease